MNKHHEVNEQVTTHTQKASPETEPAVIFQNMAKLLEWYLTQKVVQGTFIRKNYQLIYEATGSFPRWPREIREMQTRHDDFTA